MRKEQNGHSPRDDVGFGASSAFGGPCHTPTAESLAANGPPVSDDYAGETSIFSGIVNWVQIDLGADAEDADHLISPEERLRVAMARQ